MPLYEWLCSKCERLFEAVTPSDVKEYPCSCGAPSKRVLSAPGGYTMSGNNGASTSPKGSGSFKGMFRKDKS